MKIWQLNFELDKYDNLEPVNEISIDEEQTFDGRSHGRGWKPLPVERGCELEDIESLIPEHLHNEISNMKKDTFELIRNYESFESTFLYFTSEILEKYMDKCV